MADKPFDPTLKTLVETSPEAWPRLIGKPPGPTDVVDADIAITLSGAADKVLRVRAKPPYLLHLEFQAGHDSAGLPRALKVRNAVLGYRHELPVQTVVVLLRPEADSRALTEVYEEGFPGERPYNTFCYRVLRVWQQPPAAFLSGGPGLLPLAPVSAVTREQVPGIIQQMKALLTRPPARALAAEVWAATQMLLGLRYPAEVLETLLQGVVEMKESSAYQLILAEGEAKGAVEGAKKILRIQGQERFGPPDARAHAALERVTELAALEALSTRLLHVESWQELLDLPSPRRSSGRRADSK